MEGRRAATVHASGSESSGFRKPGLLVLGLNQNRAQNQLASGYGVERGAGPINSRGDTSTDMVGSGDLLAQTFMSIANAAVPQESRALMPMGKGARPRCIDLRRTMVGDEHSKLWTPWLGTSEISGFFVYTR